MSCDTTRNKRDRLKIRVRGWRIIVRVGRWNSVCLQLDSYFTVENDTKIGVETLYLHFKWGSTYIEGRLDNDGHQCILVSWVGSANLSNKMKRKKMWNCDFSEIQVKEQ